jgi:ABC-type lipoprotein release transport system permease subunit
MKEHGFSQGLVTGLVAAAILNRYVASLYQVAPQDPLTMSVAAILLLAVAMCACWIPARRATRVDPLRAIRCDLAAQPAWSPERDFGNQILILS